METVTEKLLISQAQKTENFQKIEDYVKNLCDEQLLSHMGMVNYYLICIFTQYELYEKESRDFDNLRGLLNNDNIQAKINMKATVKYVKKHWPGSFSSTPKLREYRQGMRELGLFQYPDQPKGARNGGKEQTVYQPPLMEKVDIVALIYFFRASQNEFNDRYPTGQRTLRCSKGKTMPSIIPDHGGYFVQKLHDELNLYFAEVVEENEELSVLHEQMYGDQDPYEHDHLSDRLLPLYVKIAKPLVVAMYEYGRRSFRKVKKFVLKLQEDLFDIYREDQIKAIPY